MRQLVWAASARRDYREAIAAIAADNPQAARLVQDRIKAAATLLVQRPIGRPGRVTGTYEKRVLNTPYIIAYRLPAQRLTILRIIHARRDWREMDWPDA
ncbi:MAG: type II toxin-antitoxin system RelE/ParE family toxin [Rhodospirillaceae bacterium]|nr:type II toxin-antitoxin system RelE/ParE family toxin [Rhodospirillaceae bacterium]